MKKAFHVSTFVQLFMFLIVLSYIFGGCNSSSNQPGLTNDSSSASTQLTTGNTQFPSLLYRLDSGSNLKTWLADTIMIKNKQNWKYKNYIFQFYTESLPISNSLRLVCYPQSIKYDTLLNYNVKPDTLSVYSDSTEVVNNRSAMFGSIILRRCQLNELIKSNDPSNCLLFVPSDTLSGLNNQIVYKVYKITYDFATHHIIQKNKWKSPCQNKGYTDKNGDTPIISNPCPPATMDLSDGSTQ